MTSVDTETVKTAGSRDVWAHRLRRANLGLLRHFGLLWPGRQPNSSALGYADDERQSAPEGSDLGWGCGNLQAIAELQPGERVLDLGSGDPQLGEQSLAYRRVPPLALVCRCQ